MRMSLSRNTRRAAGSVRPRLALLYLSAPCALPMINALSDRNLPHQSPKLSILRHLGRFGSRLCALPLEHAAGCSCLKSPSPRPFLRAAIIAHRLALPSMYSARTLSLADHPWRVVPSGPCRAAPLSRAASEPSRGYGTSRCAGQSAGLWRRPQLIALPITLDHSCGCRSQWCPGSTVLCSWLRRHIGGSGWCRHSSLDRATVAGGRMNP